MCWKLVKERNKVSEGWQMLGQGRKGEQDEIVRKDNNGRTR